MAFHFLLPPGFGWFIVKGMEALKALGVLLGLAALAIVPALVVSLMYGGWAGVGAACLSAMVMNRLLGGELY